MGVFTVKVALRHPERPANQLTLELVVDTGATWSLIPAGAAEALVGVQPLETRAVKTADGRRLDLPLTEVRFAIDGRSLTTPTLIGAADAPALLGAVTLEAFGLAADPIQKILVPVTGFLLGVEPSMPTMPSRPQRRRPRV
jgi:clan AA aspartic protease